MSDRCGMYLWPDWRIKPAEPVEEIEDTQHRGEHGPYYAGMAAEAVGLELGITRQKVDQTMCKALRKIIKLLAYA